MKHDDNDPLRGLLREWETPAASASFEQRVRAARGSRWTNSWSALWRGSIRLPVPVAACLAVLMALGAWKYAQAVPSLRSCVEVSPAPACTPDSNC